jgi:hypothetical protein
VLASAEPNATDVPLVSIRVFQMYAADELLKVEATTEQLSLVLTYFTVYVTAPPTESHDKSGASQLLISPSEHKTSKPPGASIATQEYPLNNNKAVNAVKINFFIFLN